MITGACETGRCSLFEKRLIDMLLQDAIDMRRAGDIEGAEERLALAQTRIDWLEERKA